MPHACRLVRLGGVLGFVFGGALLTPGYGQAMAARGGALMSQNAQSSGSAPPAANSATAAHPQSPGSITVIVRDIHGEAVPGAPMTLMEQNSDVVVVGTADSKGAFTFSGVTPGTYRVKITVAGQQPTLSNEVVLGSGEARELPVVAMEAPTTSTTVNVIATQNQVAQAQVADQEKQRVLGFLPNYYVSYIWNAAPMTPKLKFKLGLRSVTDPVTFVVVAGVAGVEQSHKTFPGYEQGVEGYAKRYASAYADTVGAAMIGRVILPSIFHQDPRYFYRGSGSVSTRILYALSMVVMCRGDNGQLEPNYSGILGSFAAAGVSNLYRAPGDRNVGLTFRNGLIVIGSTAVVNLLREFVSRKVTSSVPPFANGKP